MNLKTLSSSRSYLINTLFEIVYVFLNIYFRWGIIGELGFITGLSVVGNLFLIHRKLVTCLHKSINEGVFNIISTGAVLIALSSKQKITRKAILRLLLQLDHEEDITTVTTTTTTAVTRSKKITMNYILNKFQIYFAKFSGVFLITLGLSMPAFILQRIIYKNSHCELLYSPCVWKGVEPKVYFQSGLFSGDLSCSEKTMKKIIIGGRDCSLSLESIPDVFLNGNRFTFPNLNELDISNTNISSIPHWLLELDQLVVTNTPLSQHPVLSGYPLEYLHYNYANVFGSSVQNINLSGNRFTTFDFQSLGSESGVFPNLQTIDLSYNNLTTLLNLDYFMRNEKLVTNEQPTMSTSTIVGAPFTDTSYLSSAAASFLHLDLSHNCISISQNNDSNNSNSMFHVLNNDKIARQLSSINLQSNSIDKLPNTFIERYQNVQLVLHDNPIEELIWQGTHCKIALSNTPDQINVRLPYWIAHLSNLQTLILTSCSISNVDIFQESEFRALRYIDLSYNAIKEFSLKLPEEFSSSPPSNTISMLPISFHLKELVLVGNEIHSFSKHLFDHMTELEVLDLDNNKVAYLPPNSMKGLISLRVLVLSDNLFEEISLGLFDTLINLKELNLYYNRIKTLPAKVFDNLVNLTDLYLDRNDIEQFPDQYLFRNLKSLQFLECQRNSINGLPNYIFTNLTSIMEIDLSYNSIELIPESAFGNLPSLRKLFLSYNQIKEIPGIIMFQGLTNLKFLFMNNNQIQDIPRKIFHNLVYLKTLLLNNNFIQSLPLGIFDAIGQLRALDLDANMIDILPPLIFKSLKFLEQINLSENRIQFLYGSTFQSLTALLKIDLGENLIQSVPNNLFADLISLKTLRLDENSIKLLPDNIFANLSSLEVLDLHDNEINVLSPNLFKNTGSMEFLFLNDNSISSVYSDTFHSLTSLRNLYLNNNNFLTVEGGTFNQLSSLQVLYLNANNIQQLPLYLFDPLISLTTLNLEENSLETLPAGVFGSNLTSLELLYISDNSIGNLPEDIFSNLVSLELIYLHNNDIEVLPDYTFAGLLMLKDLYLHANKITGTLPKHSFINTTAVEILSFSNNFITSLPNTIFAGMNSLEYLYFDNNLIQDLPRGLFDDLERLKELHLDNNQIEKLPSNIFQHGMVERLSILSLFGNSIKTLPPSVFSGMYLLKELLIHGNPIATPISTTVFNDLISLRTLSITLEMPLELIDPELFLRLDSLRDLYIRHSTAPCSYFILPDGCDCVD